MYIHLKINFLLFSFLILSTSALAQIHPATPHDGYVKTLLGKTDSIAVYRHLLENAPAEFGSHVPKFAVIGRDKSFYLGVGGNVKLTVSYDFGNVLDNPNEFFTSSIPNYREPGNEGLTQFSAQQTCLFVNFVGLPDSPNKISAFIDFNLLGNNYAPALQYAYIKYRGLTAGYDKTLFSDPASTPPTIDYEGPNASSAIGNVVVDYSFSFGKIKQFKTGIGLEMPVASGTSSAQAYMVNQRVPDIPAFIQWSWDDQTSWLRLSAIMRNMLYHDRAADKNIDKMGWGVQLSGSASVVPGLTAYYQALYGKGIASYIQDMTDTGMDLIPSATNPAVLNTVKSWAAYGGLQYNITPSVMVSASYSHVRNYARGCKAPSADDQYRYAQYATGNIFWNITPILQAGAEYIYGRRVNLDGSQAHDSRLQASLQLSF